VSEVVGAVAEAEQQAAIRQAQQRRLPWLAQGAPEVVVAVDGSRRGVWGQEMDGRHSLDQDGERQGQSRGGPLGPAVVRTEIPPGTNLATIPSMCPLGLPRCSTVRRILHKFSTIFPQKRDRSLALLSHLSSMLVTSADDDGRSPASPSPGSQASSYTNGATIGLST
jgi:hypothetical protein